VNKNVVKKKMMLITTIAILLASACSSRYSSNGEHLYLRSQNGPNLVLPPSLSTANISHFYDLPNVIGNPNVGIAPPVEVAKNS
jgi:uncharacterized lipoprotein